MHDKFEILTRGIDTIIFDMDGTLVDSMWIWKDIDIEFLKAHGYDMPSNLQKEIEATSFYEIALYFKMHFHIQDPPEVIMETWNQMAMDRYKSQVPLKPGVHRFLQRVKAMGMKIGIATSNSQMLTELALGANGVLEDFDYICTGDQITKGKPAPDCYLHTARMLGSRPETCLVFEDVPMGAEAGVNAGMRVCGVYDRFSSGTREKMMRFCEEYIVSWEELL